MLLGFQTLVCHTTDAQVFTCARAFGECGLGPILTDNVLDLKMYLNLFLFHIGDPLIRYFQGPV